MALRVPTILTATTILLCLLVSVRGAQTTAFEVASIKPLKAASLPRTSMFPGCHGSDSTYPATRIVPPPLGRCVFEATTLRGLILNAYGSELVVGQITGGPAWMDSEFMSLEAKAPDDSVPTEAQLKQMLRALLAKELKLQFHREVREVPGYVLTVAKGGPKFSLSTGQDEIRVSGNGVSGILRMGSPPRIVVQNQPLSVFTDFLWSRIQSPVVDGTGLKGNYTFTINLSGPNASNELSLPETLAPDAGTSIFTALPEQLGLRLEAQKVKIDFFVIESAEKPAEL